jgi:hypothetical protein
MKAEEYRDALALIAESDRRATAQLIEHIVAACVLKLAPPADGQVASVSISPDDIESLLASHFFDATYDESGEMTLFLTPLAK